MTDSWDEYAEHWDQNEFVREYSLKAMEMLTTIVDVSEKSVLDFVCGTGLLTQKMAKLAEHVTAIDTSENMISVLRAKHLPNVTSICTELSEEWVRKFTLEAEKFDLIVASSVCGFLPDFKKTLRQLSACLKSGGLLVQWDWLKTAESPGLGLSETEIRTAYESANLVTKSVTTAFTMNSNGSDMPVLIGVATAK